MTDTPEDMNSIIRNFDNMPLSELDRFNRTKGIYACITPEGPPVQDISTREAVYCFLSGVGVGALVTGIVLMLVGMLP